MSEKCGLSMSGLCPCNAGLANSEKKKKNAFLDIYEQNPQELFLLSSVACTNFLLCVLRTSKSLTLVDNPLIGITLNEHNVAIIRVNNQHLASID